MSKRPVPKLMPEEFAAKYLYPRIRAMLAKILMERLHLSQKEAAERLGITQAAISQYLSGKRGSWKGLLLDSRALELTEQLGQEIIEKGLDKYSIVLKMSALVEYLLANRCACTIHQLHEPELDIDRCHICDGRTGLLLKPRPPGEPLHG
ncbi:MAG: hypothetical protein C4339_01690 [Nitrososphaerota archaeon]